MSRHQIFAQKQVVIDSEEIRLYGHDETSLTYNDEPIIANGINTIDNVGSTPNAKAATLVNRHLALQPASSSFPGVVTAAAQTLAGPKNFVDDVITESNFILPSNSYALSGTINKGNSRFLSSPGNNLNAGMYSGNFSGYTQSVFVGQSAGTVVSGDSARNTGVGYQSLYNLFDGAGNTCLGQHSGFNYTGAESENCCIAAPGVEGENYQIRIGNVLHTNCTITGIHGVTSAASTPVVINSVGLLGTVVSTRKRKREIEDIDSLDLEKLYQLQPKKFKMNDDKTNEQQYGLIAEEVVELMPDLVVNDSLGEPAAVQYQKLDGLQIAALLDLRKMVLALQQELFELKQLLVK